MVDAIIPFLPRDRQTELKREEFEIHKLERDPSTRRLEDTEKVLSKDQFERQGKGKGKQKQEDAEQAEVKTEQAAEQGETKEEDSHKGKNLDVWA